MKTKDIEEFKIFLVKEYEKSKNNVLGVVPEPKYKTITVQKRNLFSQSSVTTEVIINEHEINMAKIDNRNRLLLWKQFTKPKYIFCLNLIEKFLKNKL
jgi:hypothetical protein